jgi:glycosyltransferase involved in cell wall biosynthesis
VAWRNGSVPEVIDDGVTGFVVDSMDGMVEAIDRVDELDPRTARAHVEERFSAAAMVAGYERAYERILAAERS